MAESVLNKLGDGTFQAFSAGSHPTRRINALTIDELHRRGYSTAGLTSKSWTEFAQPHSPPLDFVVCVCKNAATETAPRWNGTPQRFNWLFAPPGQFTGTDHEIRSAFSCVCGEIEAAVKEFVRREMMPAALAAGG